MKNSIPKPLILIICIAGVIGVGALSGIATSTGIDSWYDTLNLPSFNPPNWIFGPVWTLLYGLLGYSLYRIIVSESTESKTAAYTIFGIQLVLNFAWSFLFFYFHQLGLALIEIIVLEICILSMIYQFCKIDKMAAYLNIPYAMWVAFATFLNLSIFLLN